jgi:hypothetical protein
MITKRKLISNFCVMPNKLLNDTRISFRARGILAYLLSKPENWRVVMADLINNSGKEGREAVRTAMAELRDAGYAKLQNITDESTKRILGREWVISDDPTPPDEKEEFRPEPESGETHPENDPDELASHRTGNVSDGETPPNKDLKTVQRTEVNKTERENETQALEVYKRYPKQVGKPFAIKAILKQGRKHGFPKLLQDTERFSLMWRGKNLDFCPHPATWFNQERFNDDMSIQGPKDARSAPQGLPAWQVIKTLEERIQRHKANPTYVGYDPASTAEMRADFSALRKQLAELKAKHDQPR